MVFKCFTKTWQAVLFDRITELFYISNSWVPCSNVHIQLWSLRKDFHWYLQFCFIFPCKTFSWISKNRFFFLKIAIWLKFYFFCEFWNYNTSDRGMRSSTRNGFLHYITVYKWLFCLSWMIWNERWLFVESLTITV